jgi:hypothetical protein
MIDADDAPIDEVAAAAALRRLDALAVEHPELLGPSGPHNVTAWIATLDDEKGPTDDTAEGFDDADDAGSVSST